MSMWQVLPPNQNRSTEQPKFIYFLLPKAFKKRNENSLSARKKQVDALEYLNPSNQNSSNSNYLNIFFFTRSMRLRSNKWTVKY